MTSANPEQIARYGHIAAVLRAYMQRFEMPRSDFNQHVLGLQRDSPTGYTWLKAMGPPSWRNRLRISQITGIAIEHLMAREPDGPPPPPLPHPSTFRAPIGWPLDADKREDLSPLLEGPAPEEAPTWELLEPPAKPRPAPDPLQFTAHADGTATIVVHKTLPIDHATKLLRVLLDSGIAP